MHPPLGGQHDTSVVTDIATQSSWEIGIVSARIACRHVALFVTDAPGNTHESTHGFAVQISSYGRSAGSSRHAWGRVRTALVMRQTHWQLEPFAVLGPVLRVEDKCDRRGD